MIDPAYIPTFDESGNPIDPEEYIRQMDEWIRQSQEDFAINSEVYDTLYSTYHDVIDPWFLDQAIEMRNANQVKLAITSLLDGADKDIIFEESLLKKIRLRGFEMPDADCASCFAHLYASARILPENPAQPVQLTPEIMNSMKPFLLDIEKQRRKPTHANADTPARYEPLSSSNR